MRRYRVEPRHTMNAPYDAIGRISTVDYEQFLIGGAIQDRIPSLEKSVTIT
jgi:hypothetical protein